MSKANVEKRFEVLEVLVVGTEQGGNPLFGDGDAAHFSYYRSLRFRCRLLDDTDV